MKKSILFLVSFVLLSNLLNVCSATYIQWDGGAGTSNWNTAANWNGDVIPGTADKAGFKSPTGAVVSTTVPTFMDMTLGGVSGGILTVQPGAVLTCTNTWSMGQSYNETGVLNISGGSITVGSWFYVGNAGVGTINITGGSITIGGLFCIANGVAATSVGTVNLDGGTITVSTFNMAAGGGAAKLDITSGKLIINGNVTSAIAGYISNGWIKGYDSPSNVHYDYNVTTPGKTTVWAVGSNKADNPTPANGAVNISRDTSLSWTAGLGAISHNIYFGTASPGTFQGNQAGTAFNPGQLALGTTYYWRIDEVSGAGTTTGDVWNFTTATGEAKNPDPASGAINIAFNKILGWTAGIGAVSHDVYLGTNSSDVNNANRLLGDLNGNGIVDWIDLSMLTGYWLSDPTGTEPYAGIDDDNIVDLYDYTLLAEDWKTSTNPVFKGNQSSTNYNPGTLATDTTYYWRIDEVNSVDTFKGNIWSFTTQSGKAFDPSPANGAASVARDTTLSWTAGAGAASHNVYFGTANPPASIGNQTAATYNPGTLDYSTTYYWRIDEIGSLGTVTGDLWNFTTVPLSTTPVYPYLTWRNDPTNSVVVNWWNPTATGNSSVDYGPTISYGSTATIATVSNFHHVELTSLTPGATYHYRVRSSDGTVGADNTFTTAEENTTSFSFAVYGDPRGGQTADEPYYSRHRVLCNWILAQNFDFAIGTGDTVWEGATPLAMSKFWPEFFEIEKDLSSSKVIMTAMGNHEVQPSGYTGSANYIQFYGDGYPANGTSGNGGRVYSFNYGNAHFINLSSYQIDLNLQKNWLAADLAATAANPNIKWIFAFMHAPMYTTNTSRGNRTDCIAAWGPLFDQYHVDIVFAGHNHLLERSRSIKNGIAVADNVGTVYVTSGLGGAGFDSPGSGSPGLFVMTYNQNTLANCVTINGNSLTVNSITNVDGIVRDTFTLSK
ncbi:MAG: metallophosphoesterase [Phycisphaerae bacterium]|nr:metallophosphoesterase [Phycisphaerae bacterium]